MGEIADGLINGDFDFYTGEYLGRGYGVPRTKNRSLHWEKRDRKNKTTNPRRGILNYIHHRYVGKAQMPSTIKIAKHYANEAGLEYKTEEEMFKVISDNFQPFRIWMENNAGKMYQTY